MSEFGKPEEGPDYSQYLQGNSWELPFDIPIPTLVEQAASMFSESLKKQGWDEDAVFGLGLGFREALINALKYGRPESNNDVVAAHVRVSFSVTPERVEVTVQDPGKGFNWKETTDPTTKEGQGTTHLRGIFLMRNYFDSVAYNEKGNEVHMSFGDEGPIGVKPEELKDIRDVLPQRLKEKGAYMFEGSDGKWYWHAGKDDMKNEKEKEKFIARQEDWNEAS